MSNLNPNRLNLIYPVADMTLMKTNANATIAKIPVLATLTEEERASGGDINVDNKIFVDDTLNELITNGATLMPAWFNIPNLSNDVTFFNQSEELISLYSNIIVRLKDAQRIAGREALVNARKAYEQYKSAADAGVSGAQASYDKLKIRFDKSPGAPAQQIQ
ncbi:hypothetical protein [Flavobacterium sp. 5]|uniref:hypothetical protein n=1 Tax=Flavobacterium sp. 5 TaxID=2035199 RepID=UPI000C2C34E8|nr:hypothetical protein [Flavobacterium sp. 5]PKB15193.1 hypothetical protein CLU82_0257 [Flavobacterium sp. 5]